VKQEGYGVRFLTRRAGGTEASDTRFSAPADLRRELRQQFLFKRIPWMCVTKPICLMGGHGIDDFVAQFAGSVGFGEADKIGYVPRARLPDDGAESAFKEVAFFLSQVDAAGFCYVLGEKRELVSTF
jgi:hypothetical protein